MKINYNRAKTEEFNKFRQKIMMAKLGVDKIYIYKTRGRTLAILN